MIVVEHVILGYTNKLDSTGLVSLVCYVTHKLPVLGL